MKSGKGNPRTNRLPSGVTEVALRDAVNTSGYPLQIEVANLLRPHFDVLQEEWSYIDRDTQELRSLDLVATKLLYDQQTDKVHTRPQLDLLIECKRSELPYLFFVSVARPQLDRFPMIAGLRSDMLQLVFDAKPRSPRVNIAIHDALAINQHPFCHLPPVARTFSKGSWKKTGVLELSGSDAYNSVILPLVKAATHHARVEAPAETHQYFDVHLTLLVAVLDAPMVAVDIAARGPSMTLTPWVRVIRHEHEAERERRRRDQLWAIDLVHKDHLVRYLTEHVLPMSRFVGALALKHEQVLADGEAALVEKEISTEPWDGTFEPYLEPVKKAERKPRGRSAKRRGVRAGG